MVLLLETWPVRVILLAAEASGHSLQTAHHPSAHTISVLLPRLPVSLDRLKMVNAASSKTPRTPCMPPRLSSASQWQNIKSECFILNGDTHDHVIFGRAALWLHRYHLNRVAVFFCCGCTVHIHQAHALLP